MNLYYSIFEHKTFLESEINRLEALVKDTNIIELKCYKHRNNHFRYYLKTFHSKKSNRRVISSNDQKQLKNLAQKTYNYYLLSDYKKELAALHYYIKHFSPSLLKAPKYLKNPGIQQLLQTYDRYEQDQWASKDYHTNPYLPEQKQLRVTENLSVRSKSEVQIALTLMQNGIPFRYECELSLQGTIIYPDFTIMHPTTGKIIYWEHFGMMDDELYKKRTAEKLQKYISAGFIPDINFIATYETEKHPLDPMSIVDKVKLILDQTEGF